MCDNTILPHLISKNRLTELWTNVNKIYRFMWRKGQLLQILSTHSAQHKIYRFIWRKWRFFFQVAKYGFFMAIFWPSNWPFCRNFWTRRCSFPQILWLSKKTCLRKWCEFYRFIWFHCNDSLALVSFPEVTCGFEYDPNHHEQQ